MHIADTYPEPRQDNDLAGIVVARATLAFLRGQYSQNEAAQAVGLTG